jgi:hypothetical protein
MIHDNKSDKTIMIYSRGLILVKNMNESDYLSGEFSDDFLHAQADAGDSLLDEECFQYRLTQNELDKLLLEGQSLLFIDSLKGK